MTEKECEAWQGTPDDYILRSRCKSSRHRPYRVSRQSRDPPASAPRSRSCGRAEDTEQGLVKQGEELRLQAVKERDEAMAALRNFVREHLEEIHDVSDEYRLCIEARRIPARRLDNRRGARTP